GRPGTQRLRLRTTNGSSLIAVSGTPAGATVTVDAQVAGISEPAEVEDAREPRDYASAIHRDGDLWRVDCDGIARHWQVETVDSRRGTDVIVSSDEGTWVLHRENVVRSAADDDGSGDGTLTSPMPGTVIALSAADGDRVEAGDPVLVVEAMKMEHTLRAPTAGVVEYHVAAGSQVSTEVALATVVPDED
ncbi:MAG TPA: acetyl/propionyl-CoA carboxylase subunit alpha, partial [Actinomycetales bacterium]|nr:acetyl/propionyl-CoA carboxylase subunit alpha [Actinomycetales bacterium]